MSKEKAPEPVNELIHRGLVQSTKDIPIRQIEREAYRQRKLKYGSHHIKLENREENSEKPLVGQEIVEQVLNEKMEREAAEAPKFKEEIFEGIKLERVASRDLEFEKMVSEMSKEPIS